MCVDTTKRFKNVLVKTFPKRFGNVLSERFGKNVLKTFWQNATRTFWETLPKRFVVSTHIRFQNVLAQPNQDVLESFCVFWVTGIYIFMEML